MVLLDRFLAERDRWPLWAPVLLGLGVGWYFALDAEPWGGAGLVATLVLAGAAVVVRRRRDGRGEMAALALVAAALVAAGLALAQGRTWWVAAPVLERPSGRVDLVGTVAETEFLPAGEGQRVTLTDLSGGDAGLVLPTRARLRLRDGPVVAVGERIAVTALLMPPAPPAFPGAYDFSRDAWFLGLGAVGTVLGPARLMEPAPDGTGWNLAALRARITARILAVLPGDVGGVAAALVTGETLGISAPLLAAYRDSGLAHLLSISGLHMSLLAGMVFFVVRGGLALLPGVALYRPIKKWAAAVALAVTFFYLLLSGAPVPAQRSFLMTGLALVAVLADRAALTLRLVAWAAVAVLVSVPESLTGPSFQMSFAAVVALISGYERLTPLLARWRQAGGRWLGWGLVYLGGLVASSLLAGGATSVYGAYHFNRLALWSVVANLLAVPLTGAVVMPFAIAGLVLMPLGLEALALVPMGWGIAAVNRVAEAVAALPLAAVSLPPLPLWGLVVFTLGGLWLCLWRTGWRLWGLAPMLVGLAGFWIGTPPDLVVDGRGYAFGVRQADGSLLVNRGGRILRETWNRRAGPLSSARWPKGATSPDRRLSCAGKACVYRIDARAVALILDEDGVDGACAGKAAVVSAVPLRGRCRDVGLVVDRFDLWRRGAHALWALPGGGWRVETMVDIQGDRPWSYRARPRRRKVEDMAPSDDTSDEKHGS